MMSQPLPGQPPGRAPDGAEVARDGDGRAVRLALEVMAAVPPDVPDEEFLPRVVAALAGPARALRKRADARGSSGRVIVAPAFASTAKHRPFGRQIRRAHGARCTLVGLRCYDPRR